MSNTQSNPVMQARLLAIAADLVASMENNIQAIEAIKQRALLLTAKLPTNCSSNIRPVISDTDNIVIEARQRIKRYHSVIKSL